MCCWPLARPVRRRLCRRAGTLCSAVLAGGHHSPIFCPWALRRPGSTHQTSPPTSLGHSPRRARWHAGSAGPELRAARSQTQGTVPCLPPPLPSHLPGFSPRQLRKREPLNVGNVTDALGHHTLPRAVQSAARGVASPRPVCGSWRQGLPSPARRSGCRGAASALPRPGRAHCGAWNWDFGVHFCEGMLSSVPPYRCSLDTECQNTGMAMATMMLRRGKKSGGEGWGKARSGGEGWGGHVVGGRDGGRHVVRSRPRTPGASLGPGALPSAPPERPLPRGKRGVALPVLGVRVESAGRRPEACRKAPWACACSWHARTRRPWWPPDQASPRTSQPRPGSAPSRTLGRVHLRVAAHSVARSLPGSSGPVCCRDGGSPSTTCLRERVSQHPTLLCNRNNA